MMGRRRAGLLDMRYGEDRTVYAEYLVPTRGLLGFRQPFLIATRGTGIFHTLFHGYEPYTGEINTRDRGSLVALETGKVTSYALMNLQERGIMFVTPTTMSIQDMVGQYTRDDDLQCCKTKHLTTTASPAEINGLTCPDSTLDDASII
jgi:GTP-binding protein